MKNGYTVPELLVLIIVIGFFAVLAISKGSYAFEDEQAITAENNKLILVKGAILYGESIKESLKKEKTQYISSNDLVEAGYLIQDDDVVYTIKITYDEENDKIDAEVVEK